jgi:hypothetical protein
VSYSIFITPSALDMLSRISDQKTKIKIRNAIDGLSDEPEKKVVVLIVAVGQRKEGSKCGYLHVGQETSETAGALISLKCPKGDLYGKSTERN